MKYAIISDVHGNLNALTAVLNDAEYFGVDKYIFVGDYCSYLPYPNEVVNKIKSLENNIIVQGNEEGYLTMYSKQDQSTWTDGQFQAHYWCYRAINSINHEYLAALPKRITFSDSDMNITVTHSSADIYGDIDHKEFSSLKVAAKYEMDNSFSREKLLNDIGEYLKKAKFTAVIQSLPDNIYVFGHTHVQWNARIGNKIFINPGSCGLVLDGLAGAPYTLLDIDNEKIDITERRVQYDFDKLLHEFQNSSLFEAAPVWCNIILKEMTARFGCVLPFLQFVNEYANKIDDPIRPYSVKTWTEAYNAWQRV